MKIFTIGFTKTTASAFFNRITESGTKKIIDVRLNNVSQLAGFAKRDDLKFFAERISQVGYKHLTCLAPDQNMLDKYKKHKGSWHSYADEFISLMRQRKIEYLGKDEFDGACLLCSEDKPHHCHRRLVAEYLSDHWGGIEIKHL
jgi:uncharacterized protein (DUF488 family)